MVLCGNKNGSYGIAVKNLLSTFIFKSVHISYYAILLPNIGFNLFIVLFSSTWLRFCLSFWNWLIVALIDLSYAHQILNIIIHK